MKRLILAAIFFAASASVMGKSNECQKAFGHQIATCQKAVDNKSFTAQFRAEAHVGCITQAREAKWLCESGTNLCVVACDEFYVSFVAQCEADFTDPSICGGDPACEAVLPAFLQNCLNAALNTYNSCISSCPGQQP